MLSKLTEPKWDYKDIPNFNGSPPEDVMPFFDKYEQFASFKNWNEEEKIHYLKIALTGPAQSKLKACLENSPSFSDVKEKLIKSFITNDVLFTLSTRFNEIQQGNDESLESYYQRFKALQRILSNNLPMTKYDNHLNTRAFINGLNHPEVQDRISHKEPGNVDQAFQYAQKELTRNYYKMSVMQEKAPIQPPQSISPTPQGSRRYKLCEYCGKSGHEILECWWNPQSPNHLSPQSSPNGVPHVAEEGTRVATPYPFPQY